MYICLMEIKKGGKRAGAGRKPLGLKKKSIFLYVEGNLILNFGSEEKMKVKLYEFIKSYGEHNEKIFEGETEPFKDHGLFIPQEPKGNYFTPNPSAQSTVLSKRQVYISDLNECRDYEEIKKVMIRSKSDTLSNLDRQMLDIHLKSLMEEKGIEPY